jgi:hypothetical protein
MDHEVVTKVRHRNPMADYQDQAMFFGSFVVGAGAILGMKYLGFNQFAVTAVPVALMVIYALVAIKTKRFRLREDRVGDNIYYLGFLFTLTSLACALYVYNPDGDGVTAIITNFGIAISTTIVGLAGRVLFNQMREDPVEYEREARYSLAEASRALRSQLFDISTDLTSFRRAIVQITEEAVTEVADSAKTSMTTNVKEFTGAAQEVITNIRSAFEKFSDHSAKLNDIAGKNVDALEALFRRIESIEAQPGLVVDKLTPIVDKFHEIADEAMRRNQNQTKDLKRIKDTIDAAIEASSALMNTVGAADKGVRERLDAFSASLDTSTKLAKGFADTITGASQSIAVELKAATTTAEDVVKGIQAQKDTIESVRELIEAELARMQQHQVEMDRMAKESTESVQIVQSALVSLSKQLVEQVSGEPAASAN